MCIRDRPKGTSSSPACKQWAARRPGCTRSTASRCRRAMFARWLMGEGLAVSGCRLRSVCSSSCSCYCPCSRSCSCLLLSRSPFAHTLARDVWLKRGARSPSPRSCIPMLLPRRCGLDDVAQDVWLA
eukprot:5377619-Alexandrium_andersonii.AAC.1